jgi:dipeptidyl aminopeptidase/acylaminoacyl peptidase
MKCLTLFVVVLTLCGRTHAADKRPMELEDMFRIKRVSDLQLSPDGRWVAYESSETGRTEIYVQPFPGPGPKSQISVGGGGYPRWRRDGLELFYLAPGRQLMAVAIAQRGSILDAGPPHFLFTLSTSPHYEPSPDGRRFLVNTVVSDASPITIILNWKAPGS